jgi:hypothetical protein
MNFSSILQALKSFIPILEPLGEQGVNQLFSIIDAEIAKLASPDLKEAGQILSPALRQFAIAELKKLQ